MEWFGKQVDKVIIPLMGIGIVVLIFLAVVAATVGLVGCGIVGADIPMCSD